MILYMNGVEQKLLFLQRTKLIPISFCSTFTFLEVFLVFLIKYFHKENSSPLLVHRNLTVEHSQQVRLFIYWSWVSCGSTSGKIYVQPFKRRP